MISKIGDSDASQDFATQSPRTNGHLTVTVLKTTWYVVYFFCLCYSELLNKTDVVFLQLLMLLLMFFELFPCFPFCFLLFFVRSFIQ